MYLEERGGGDFLPNFDSKKAHDNDIFILFALFEASNWFAVTFTRRYARAKQLLAEKCCTMSKLFIVQQECALFNRSSGQIDYWPRIFEFRGKNFD